MRVVLRGGAVAGLLAGLAALTRYLTGHVVGERLLLALASMWVLFALAVPLVRRLPLRPAMAVVVLGGVALQLVALTGPPRRTDDWYRYVWDGRVQAAGIDPYRYAPLDPALAGLRDPWLFPDEEGCRALGRDPGCTRINRPAEHTIYPPVAELSFRAVHAASPAGSEHRPVQVAAALAAIATTLLLTTLLPRMGADPRLAVLWAWCPTVVLEAGNSAHVDVLAAPLVVGALAAAARRRAGLGGALLGLAVGVKLVPLLVLPAMVRRRPAAVVGAAAGVLAIAYLPHLLAVGPAVLGYLPGYLREEGYADGSRFLLLRLVVPDALAPYAAVAVLAAAALVVLRTADPDRAWRAALVLTGTALLVATPGMPWYGLLLAALVALDGRWEWLAVAAAAFPAYYAFDLGERGALVQPVSYGAALLCVLTASAWRARASYVLADRRVITDP